jgi:serine/threonine protein kinase
MQCLKVGHILRTHYKIEKILGQGGFGIVYLVKDIDLKKDNFFIIKELFLQKYSFRRDSSRVYNNKNVESFIDEIKDDVIKEVDILSEIENDNILKAYGSFRENNTIYSIMEYIDGEDLEKYIKKNRAFDEDEAIDLLRQMIHGLKDIHIKGIIHRDIKPSNIMKTKDGLYKIIDFTTNKSYSTTEVNITDIKSHGYTSPELEKTKATIGAFSDIYSIGMTLIKILSLQEPLRVIDRYFDDKPLQNTIDTLKISYKFKEIIRRMTTISVDDRFQNLEEIQNILDGNIALLPIGYRIDNYRIEKFLSQDEFNIIYLVRETNSSKRFIIKEFFIKNYSLRKLYREIVITREFDINIIKEFYKKQNFNTIKDNNILLVYKLIEKNHTLYSIIEHIEGLYLEEYIKENLFDEKESIELLNQLINMLSTLYSQNILHKSLNPFDIIRTQEGIYKIDYLLNPVVALEPYFDEDTIPFELERYASPELLKGGSIKEFSDIYSIGMILCRVLMRDKEKVFTVHERKINETQFQQNIDNLNISLKFKKLIKKMVELKSEDRFQNLDELSRAINTNDSWFQRTIKWFLN